MSGVARQPSRRRRLPKIFLVKSDMKIQDHLDGTIRVLRGSMCVEQESERNGKGDHLWVKILDTGGMVKIVRHVLMEVPPDLAGLLEPVPEPEARLKLFDKASSRLQRLAFLPLGSPVSVILGQGLAEAELRYRGPLTRGSTAIFFGVQLKGWAAGKGISNGSFKGHQLFTCPEACALFVPASQLTLRRSSRETDAERHHPAHISGPHNHNHNHTHSSVQPPPPGSQQHQQQPVSILSRTAESVPGPVPSSAPAPAPLLMLGQRVIFTQEGEAQTGKVAFCGTLPTGGPRVFVGLILDSPVGNWDGMYKNHRLCSVPSPQYGHLLPLSKVTPVETKPQKSPPPAVTPKPALKPPSLPTAKVSLVPVLPPYSKPALKPVNAPKPVSPTYAPTPPATVPSPPPYSTTKVPLQPPGKASASPPSPPIASQKPAPPPPPPANLKPRPPPMPLYPGADQSGGSSNGLPGPPSPPQPEEMEFELEEESGLGLELEVGSMVEVNNPPQFGVIRWIGRISGISELVAGVELDQEITAGTDGSYLGERYFRCPSNKGLFVKLRSCRRDSRFPAPETPINQVERCNSIAFAEWGSERVEEHTPPMLGSEAKQHYQGWKKGIQGHLNSCYLDASLFSLFSCCSSADSVLFCPPGPQDGPHSRAAQDLLRCEIVNPLRRYGYVCASKTMALRKLLEAETTDTGFTNEEKDPEEFLNKLFQLLRVEPLLRIRSMNHQPQECHIYQLFPPSTNTSPSSPSALSPSLSPAPLSPIPLSPPSGHLRVATVQALLEASFIHSGLKFAEAPSCLPLLMPRFGKDFKMFDAILPSLTLDITDLLDETLRQCSICQSLAHWECLQCYEDQDITPGRLKQFCNTCNTQVHNHKKRSSHQPERVRTPKCPWAEQWDGPLGGSRQQLELFAVTCIETSHYVSFVRHGPQPNDWLFFDSMADREGGENGFNVPHVRACPEVGRYLSLSEEELSRLDPASLKDTVRRLLCDSYMCLYHCPQISLYK